MASIGLQGGLRERLWVSGMIGYMSLEEQVDRDFQVARRRALLGRLAARFRRASEPGGLLAFDDVRKARRADNRIHVGRRVVEVSKIVGSAGRHREFGGGFMPARARTEARWKRIDRAFHRGEELPPVSLYKIGDEYFVHDGNHRVSVARFHGVEMIEAEVTEFRPRLSANPERCGDGRRPPQCREAGRKRTARKGRI